MATEVLSTRLRQSESFKKDVRVFVALEDEKLRALKAAVGSATEEIDEDEVEASMKALDVVRGTAMHLIYTYQFLTMKLAEEDSNFDVLISEIEQVLGQKIDEEKQRTLREILTPTAAETESIQEAAAFNIGCTYLGSNFRTIFAPGVSENESRLYAGFVWNINYQDARGDTQSTSLHVSVTELRDLAKRIEEVCRSAEQRLKDFSGGKA